MKRSLLLLTLFALIPQANAANRESGGRKDAAAVYLNFFSIGEGTDYVTRQEAITAIANAKQAGVVLDETTEPWGREGEVLLCVQFTDATERYNFVQFIAPLIKEDSKAKGYVRTEVRVGLECRNYENATPQDLSSYK